MKSEFLQLWDGMLSENTDNKYGIVVVGATSALDTSLMGRNRPWDIDKAFLRRLPCTFLVDLPVEPGEDCETRVKNSVKRFCDLF